MKKLILISLLILLSACKGSVSVGSNSQDNDGNQDNDTTTTIIDSNGDDIKDVSKIEDCEGDTVTPDISVDGQDGFLYKPESDSDNKPVILLPASFDVVFDYVSAEKLGGERVAGVFSGMTNPDRQTWRFDVNASELTGRMVAEKDGVNCSILVPNPAIRQD